MNLLIRKSFKYRIYPTRAQVSNLENQFSMCRHLYNWNLKERIEAYEKDGTIISYNQQQNQLPQLKIERPWYKGVYSQVLQDVLRRLDNGYQAFFRRVENGETPGFPNFKKHGEWNSITYPQYHAFPESRIKVPKVGIVKTVHHRQIPKEAEIKTLTIIREGCKWFACFSVELPLDIEPEQDLQNAIGIDFGLNDFLYASDGSHVSTPKFLRKSLDKLARLQRRFARAKKRSARWYKLLKAIRKCHYKIRCQRHDFLHKTANALLKLGNVICHEDLNIRGMSRRPKPVQDKDGKYLPNRASVKAGLNKSINDAGWYQFLLYLKYKAVEQGKQIIGVPPQYTSQKCSACGQIVKKSLSVRTHRCSCGFVANRDHNAAINILCVGLDTLATSVA
ncbi:MAG: RNA-guided endonuclease InsQ/TnpB family protein [Desulfobacter sp.]